MVANECKINPEDYDSYERKMDEVSILVEQFKYQEAVEALEFLVGLNVRESFLFLTLGSLYSQLEGKENIKRAKENLQKAVDLSESLEDKQHVSIAAKSSLGKIYLSEAINEFRALPQKFQWEELERTFPVCSDLRSKFFLYFYSHCRNNCTPPNGGKGYKTSSGCKTCPSI